MNGWSCNIHAKNDDFPIDFAIFTKALPTDGPTDRPTDGRTDIPSYRDTIAASKKQRLYSQTVRQFRIDYAIDLI